MHIIFYHRVGRLNSKKQDFKFIQLSIIIISKCPTDFNASDCSVLPFKFSKSKHRISIRSPILWKSIPTNLGRKNTGKLNHFFKKKLM